MWTLTPAVRASADGYSRTLPARLSVVACTSSPAACSRATPPAPRYTAGFEEVGVQRRHGKLDGEWKDCVLVERQLGEAVDA
jgi:hypothetical protein